MPVEIRKVLRLNAGDRIDFVAIDNGRVEMIPKKGAASALKRLVKWRSKPATVSQMDKARMVVTDHFSVANCKASLERLIG